MSNENEKPELDIGIGYNGFGFGAFAVPLVFAINFDDLNATLTSVEEELKKVESEYNKILKDKPENFISDVEFCFSNFENAQRLEPKLDKDEMWIDNIDLGLRQSLKYEQVLSHVRKFFEKYCDFDQVPQLEPNTPANG